MTGPLKKLLSGRGITAAELGRLARSEAGVVALAALCRANIRRREALLELHRPPRQVGKFRTVEAARPAKKAVKSARHRKI